MKKQKKQIDEHAVKKFLHSRAFKTILNRAVADSIEQLAQIRED